MEHLFIGGGVYGFFWLWASNNDLSFWDQKQHSAFFPEPSYDGYNIF